ncbi:MAG: glycosyltransferase [Clostridia bacterium]|nr:glycosyltransferase [Clostridia bacterium]
MLILSNGLTEKVDEGFLKVASSLIKRIKKAKPDTVVVSYDRKTDISDHHLNLNKLLLNKELFSLLRKEKQEVLYIPFPAKALSTALRIFILSLFSKPRVKVILVMRTPFDFASRLLLNLSRAEIIVFSKASADFYKNILSKKRVTYLKTGVDTEKFIPVSEEKQRHLKEKYNISPEKKVILHVGHLKVGRNIDELTKLDSKYQILLVVSQQFENEKDTDLRQRLESKENIKILDSYIPEIEEVYQLADVYFFPVKDEGNCIDVPLSCLEAAACNKPVVTTDYGEMKEFLDKEGFYFIDAADSKTLNSLIEIATNKTALPRDAVIEYNWDNALKFF